MKPISSTLGFSALLCMAMMAPAAVKAQSATPPGAKAAPAATAQSAEGPAVKNPSNKMVKRMTKELSLTPDQRHQVKALIEERQTQLDALSADATMTEKGKKLKKTGHSVRFRLQGEYYPHRRPKSCLRKDEAGEACQA